ncbi:hypothetical protein [uncultured Clostridium sp.]|uniref:hypothetical protein n=1 Tax=uncultured Clostridium sp. TaxID=59620 RepID=UPI0025914AAF|nr:hypothetical protein [uncultured Clostridium sp.]
MVSSRPSFNTSNTDNKSNTGVSLQTQPQKDEFKRITKGQIRDIKKYPQFARSDCYLVASLKSLAKSGFGQQMLKNSVSSNQDRTAFNVQFKHYENSDKDTYNVHKNDENSSIAFEVATGRPDFRTIGAVEKATSDMNGEKSDAKPWYLKVFNKYGTNLEGNQASYFMRNLTGVEPINIGDEGLMSLSHSNKEQATKLLDKIGEFPMNRHSFVAGSKIMGTKNVGSSHYYVLNKVDNKEKKVYLRDPRYSDLSQEDMQQYIKDSCKIDSRIDTEKKAQKAIDKAKSKPKEICLSYDDFMKDFRSIVGYFDKKVVKNYDVNQE